MMMIMIIVIIMNRLVVNNNNISLKSKLIALKSKVNNAIGWRPLYVPLLESV